MKVKGTDFVVGLFVVAAVIGLVFLALKASGLTLHTSGEYYTVQANFDNVGSLKVRAPVSVAGVSVGRVQSIGLDPETFQAIVTLQIDKNYNHLPLDTSASILTQGILGANYIGLTPGFEEKNLKNDSVIRTTHPALVLENLIGQLIYSMKPSDAKETGGSQSDAPSSTTTVAPE